MGKCAHTLRLPIIRRPDQRRHEYLASPPFFLSPAWVLTSSPGRGHTEPSRDRQRATRLYARTKHPPPRCNSGALPQLNSPDGHRAASVVALICLSSPHEVAGGTSATILCHGRIPWLNARNRPADSLNKPAR